ncbi:dUTP diphosphatase, partial [Klebsiella pneumoniae]
PGTIDSGYRGQINVLLVNTDPREPVHLDAGYRIAQLVVVPVAEAIFEPVEDLDDTERGQGGYGSTGVSAMPPVDG